MRQSRIVVVSLIVLAVAVVEAAAQDMREIYRSRDGAGQERVYRVAASTLAATKKWSPEIEPPPLSIASAIAAALKSLSPRDTDSTRAVQIDMISTAGPDFRWFYRIELFDNSPTRRMEVLEVLVLMDGSVVKASPGRERFGGQ